MMMLFSLFLPNWVPRGKKNWEELGPIILRRSINPSRVVKEMSGSKARAKLLKKATGGRGGIEFESAAQLDGADDAGGDDESDDESDGSFAPGGAGSGSGSDEEGSGEDSDDEEGSDESSDEDDESDDSDGAEGDEDPLAHREEGGDGSSQDVTAATVAANKPNEDRFFVDAGQRLFGVFDGHGGRHCSQFAVENIGQVYAKLNTSPEDTAAGLESLEGAFFSAAESKAAGERAPSKVKALLKRTFQTIDDEFFKALGDDFNVCGTCGVVCAVEDGCVWAANAGDSRAIVVEDRDRGGIHGVAITTDLNTSCKSECDKVAARSSDTDAVRYNERDRAAAAATKRVAGSLMVTRALGDGYLKRKELSMPPFEDHVPYITAKPKVSRMDLDKRHTFLVIASDGVWDHLSNDEAAIEIDRAAKALDSTGTLGERTQGKRKAADAGPECKTLAMSLIQTVMRKIADKNGLSVEGLRSLRPGKMRRDFLDDMTAVVVRLGGLSAKTCAGDEAAPPAKKARQ